MKQVMFAVCKTRYLKKKTIVIRIQDHKNYIMAISNFYTTILNQSMTTSYSFDHLTILWNTRLVCFLQIYTPVLFVSYEKLTVDFKRMLLFFCNSKTHLNCQLMLNFACCFFNLLLSVLSKNRNCQFKRPPIVNLIKDVMITTKCFKSSRSSMVLK